MKVREELETVKKKLFSVMLLTVDYLKNQGGNIYNIVSNFNKVCKETNFFSMSCLENDFTYRTVA